MEISLGLNQKGDIEKILPWEHSEKTFIESDTFIHSFMGKTMFDALDPQVKRNPLPKKTINAFVSAIHRGLLMTAESFGTNITVALKKREKEDDLNVEKDVDSDNHDDPTDHQH